MEQCLMLNPKLYRASAIGTPNFFNLILADTLHSARRCSCGLLGRSSREADTNIGLCSIYALSIPRPLPVYALSIPRPCPIHTPFMPPPFPVHSRPPPVYAPPIPHPFPVPFPVISPSTPYPFPV